MRSSSNCFIMSFFLGFNVIIPMIIAPDIFSQVKGQSFFPDATFCGKVSLQVSPEPFKPVNVAPLAITVLSGIVFYQAMNIAFGSNTGVRFWPILAELSAKVTFLASIRNHNWSNASSPVGLSTISRNHTLSISNDLPYE